MLESAQKINIKFYIFQNEIVTRLLTIVHTDRFFNLKNLPNLQAYINDNEFREGVLQEILYGNNM